MSENRWGILGLIILLSGILVFNTIDLMAEVKMEDRFRRRYYEKIADRLYDSREVSQNLEISLRYYKKAKNYSNENPGLDWKITRAYWMLADRALKKEEQMRYFKEGIRYGTLAVEKDRENSNAHLWYSLIVGKRALAQGVMNTIYNRDKIKKGFEKALTLDSKNTNAYIGLAVWYYNVPAFLGGDKQTAFQMIERAIKIESNYLEAQIIKAEFYIKEQNYQQAKKTLKHLLQIKKTVILGDGIENREKARKLLEALKRDGHIS